MELGDYLEAHETEGAVDSRGTFSLNLLQALEKMRELAQSQPHEFVLRAVQAGVASESPNVRVNIQGRYLTISFQSCLGDTEDLLSWLTGARMGLSRAQAHMAMALALAPQSWTLQSGASIVKREGQQISNLSSDRPLDGVCWNIPLSQINLTEFRKVMKRTRYSRVPIILEGVETFGSWITEKPSPSSLQLGDPADLFCSLTFTDKDGFTLPRLPMNEMEASTEGYLWSGCQGWLSRKTAFPQGRPSWLLSLNGLPPSPKPRWNLRRAIRRPLYDIGKGNVTFIVDGVCLPSEWLDSTSNIEVLEYADWATTDLGGHVIKGKKYELFLQNLSIEIAQLQVALTRCWHKISTISKGKARKSSLPVSRALLQGLGLVSGSMPCDQFHDPFLGRNGHVPLAKFGYEGPYLALLNGQLELLNVFHYQKSRPQRQINLEANPPIVPLLSAFYDNDTSPAKLCLVLPYINDPTLAEVRWKMSFSRQLRTIAQIVDGLARLHPKFTHGHLTPSRIFVGTDDMVRFVNPEVLHFEFILQSQANMCRTSPSYKELAFTTPEEVAGNREVEAGRDLYKLGVLLRETLNGAPIEIGSKDTLAVLYGVLYNPPPDVTNEYPQYSPELTGMVTKLLQKKPEERLVDLKHLAILLRQTADEHNSQISLENF